MSTSVPRAISVLCIVLLVSGCSRPVSTVSQPIRITTWNLKWFPNGSPKTASPEEQTRQINAAADVLRPLDSDILLLQEVKNYDACARLGEAIAPGTYHVAICSKFSGNQQVAILAKHHAWAAWYERWRSMDGVDPPRGLAFAWFRIGDKDIGVYSVHLKSNLIRRGDKEAESARNIRKREVAARQILHHMRMVVEPKMPSIKSIVVGGDFNTNFDQPMFATERTLHRLMEDGFVNVFGSLPLNERVTHPGSRRFPDATFDYLFVRGAAAGEATITRTTVSDHYPVTVDVVIQ